MQPGAGLLYLTQSALNEAVAGEGLLPPHVLQPKALPSQKLEWGLSATNLLTALA